MSESTINVDGLVSGKTLVTFNLCLICHSLVIKRNVESKSPVFSSFLKFVWNLCNISRNIYLSGKGNLINTKRILLNEFYF